MNQDFANRAAVIDIGSNTIKVIAGEKRDGSINILADETVETRISTGMVGEPPLLSPESMKAAVDAVRFLIHSITPPGSIPVEIVATSAVRDAGNREVLAEMIEESVGLSLTVLSGEEEALGIAMGIAREPGLDPDSEYTVSDLGGGSLEWIHRDQGKLVDTRSFNLGAVRLMNRFVSDPAAPLAAGAVHRIRQTCLDAFDDCIPRFDPNRNLTHWGTGGAFTITRRLMATANGVSLRDQSEEIPVSSIRAYAENLGSLPLSKRKMTPGLPESRADILPVALIVLSTLAGHAGIDTFRHSFNNLRVGRLANLLDVEC